ncbi:unnamed protein product [Rhodiola kirilowii]
MTGDSKFLAKIRPVVTKQFVTFGDGGKGQVIGCGTLKVPDLPVLKDTLLVEGLKVNLISISQLCDGGYHVKFTHNSCHVLDKDGGILMKGSRAANNCYLIGSTGTDSSTACLSSQADEMSLWHRRLGHLNLKTLKKLGSSELIRGMPNVKGNPDVVCGECQIGKQTKASHPKVSQISTSRPLELIHMDLMGPMQTESYGGKKYVLVCVEDFTRFTWTRFLRDKTEAAQQFIELATLIQRERDDRGEKLVSIRSDNGTEFKNATMRNYCMEHGIAHQFASAITPQQNGVVERKNRTIQEMARVMIHAKNIPLKFWSEAMNTACHILNRVSIRTGTEKTCYELWKGKKPTVKYFHIFGSECYILNDREYRQKLDPKSDEGFFLGYSSNSRAYRVFNKRTGSVMESINVKVKDEVVVQAVSDDSDDSSCTVPESQPSSQHTEGEPNTSNNTNGDSPSTDIVPGSSKSRR